MTPISHWEFYLIEVPEEDELEDLQKTFNALGSEGWELISFDDTTAIFKRRKVGLD